MCTVDDDGADSSVDQFGLRGHAVETTLVMTNLCHHDGGDRGAFHSGGGSEVS